jgi:uncharacterized membrane protein (UPF0127 family)
MIYIKASTPGAASSLRFAPFTLPFAVLWAFLFALLAGAGARAQEPQRLPTVTLRAGMHNIVAMVARTPEQRAVGLMHRREMATHEGMLFVFEQPSVQCFWMKNTLLPLSIAFIADDGSIVNLADMQPQSLDSHCSVKPVRYALEMNQGWFARRAVGPGFRLAGGPFGN